jgi:hypothetical protein
MRLFRIWQIKNNICLLRIYLSLYCAQIFLSFLLYKGLYNDMLMLYKGIMLMLYKGIMLMLYKDLYNDTRVLYKGLYNDMLMIQGYYDNYM